jgi:hypothetical protein
MAPLLGYDFNELRGMVVAKERKTADERKVRVSLRYVSCLEFNCRSLVRTSTSRRGRPDTP